jgi:hypothetical protein
MSPLEVEKPESELATHYFRKRASDIAEDYHSRLSDGRGDVGRLQTIGGTD